MNVYQVEFTERVTVLHTAHVRADSEVEAVEAVKNNIGLYIDTGATEEIDREVNSESVEVIETFDDWQVSFLFLRQEFYTSRRLRQFAASFSSSQVILAGMRFRDFAIAAGVRAISDASDKSFRIQQMRICLSVLPASSFGNLYFSPNVLYSFALGFSGGRKYCLKNAVFLEIFPRPRYIIGNNYFYRSIYEQTETFNGGG